MSIGLIQGINGLSDPRLTALLLEICQKIEALELENKNLRQKIADLEDIQDDHTTTINNHAEAINKVWVISKRCVAPKGAKTNQRIEKLNQLLKGGPRALRQLEKDLGISPQEMSRLITKLDKRKYILFARDGNKREKIIKLRSKID